MQKSYEEAFQKFISHTNEKEVLRENLLEKINTAGARSLLDIGAGDGELAVPISRQVDKYVAVEPREKYIKKLELQGLKVIPKKFPTHIEDTFDMVLSSHSIPYSSAEVFIREAWKLVNDNGNLLIITYRGEEDDWTHLMTQLNVPVEDINRNRFNDILSFLQSLGKVEVNKIETLVTTNSLSDMMEALSFVFIGSVDEKRDKHLMIREKMEKIIESKYKTQIGYEFPFQHFFITTHKIRQSE